MVNNMNKHEDACRSVHGILYSIGAPLNDNILGFTRKQMGPLFKISEVLGLR
jgi:hypothetical protein